MTPADDRLVVEAMASQIDIHHVKLTDEAAVAQCLMRAGWRAKLINRLMDRAIARTCELRTLRTILAPAIDCRPSIPSVALSGGALRSDAARRDEPNGFLND